MSYVVSCRHCCGLPEIYRRPQSLRPSILFTFSPPMAASRLFRPASRHLSTKAFRAPVSSFRPAFPVSYLPSRRGYATPAGSKEYTVRDALNEALAEELEANDKVFVLGEEVAQYNGA